MMVVSSGQAVFFLFRSSSRPHLCLIFKIHLSCVRNVDLQYVTLCQYVVHCFGRPHVDLACKASHLRNSGK